MKVLLDLPEETLSKFKEVADKEKRSRKVCMEMVLNGYKKGIPLEPSFTPSKHDKRQDFPEPSGYETWESKILGAESLDDLETIGRSIEADKNLSFTQKRNLKQLGQETALNFQ